MPLAFAFATSPALIEIEIETAVAVLALSVAFPSEGFSDAPANTAAAAGLAASAKIFGKNDTAGARWIAGDFTKYAPAETLIEPRCLEADRVKYTCPAATPTRFFLRQRHHASTDIATP